MSNLLTWILPLSLLVVGAWALYDMLVARIDHLEYQLEELRAVIQSQHAMMEALYDIGKNHE